MLASHPLDTFEGRSPTGHLGELSALLAAAMKRPNLIKCKIIYG